ncbi:MAG TPA: MBL fold metallo-hydrolase [Anaerolineae bacterium]|nr:MBL fold metallo-hydrolase [Anaerolineae bacterium]
MDKLTPQVFVEAGYRGCTVGAIVTPLGIVCVDTPLLPADARQWRERLATLSNQPIVYTIYTDGHRDRVLGQQWLGGMVVAHEATWEKLRSYGDAMRQQVVDFLTHHSAPEAAEELARHLQLGLPQLTVNNAGALTLHLGKPKIVVRPVGGATPGSVWVELPDQGVVFAGDVVTQRTHPFMSEANTMRWLERLAELREANYFATKIVPGRGGGYRRADMQKVVAYLTDMRVRVRKIMTERRGKFDAAELLPEFLDRFPIPNDEHERVQRRIRTGLERVYEELKTEKRRKKK